MNDSLESRTIETIKHLLGKQFLDCLCDDSIIEIMRNPNGSLWIERVGQGMEQIGEMPTATVVSVIKLISTLLEKETKKESPLLEGEFPLDGSRFAAQLPPVVESPSFAIRKKVKKLIPLEEYLEKRIITEDQYKKLIDALIAKKNIIVSGSTSSGKTTFVNALINKILELYPNERIFSIEDTYELMNKGVNCVQYHTSLEVSQTLLVKTAFRMNPERLMIGEIRGDEAVDLLIAWNSGHSGGASTIHADNCELALVKLSTLATMRHNAPKAIDSMIADCVDIVVHMGINRSKNRFIKEMKVVNGFDKNTGKIKLIDL